MKRISLALVVSLAVCSFAQQSGDKSSLGIFAETRYTRIPGIKPIKMPKLPAGIKIPASARAYMPGMPTRSLTVRLWSPDKAPDDAQASLAIPSGLQLGDKLNLEVYRPTPPPTSTATPGQDQSHPTQSHDAPDLTIKIYWGSSSTVKEGQPKVFTLATLPPEAQMMMMSRLSQAQASGAAGIYRPTGTTAFWPKPADAPEIKDDASMLGTYTLNSNFAGTSTIDAPTNVDFLAPIEITSPNLDNKVSLDGSLAWQWNAIPNCLGQYATAFGIQDKNTLILWTSSEEYGEKIATDLGYLQMDDVKGYVGQHVFMPGDSTNVTIPAGIFKDCQFAMYNMFGYGPGAATSGGSPVTRIQTKTNLSVLLTGKKGRSE